MLKLYIGGQVIETLTWTTFLPLVFVKSIG